MNSYWIDSFPKIINNSKELTDNLTADVCIVGGGITGISTAYELAKAGLKVVILEKCLLAEKASGNTTAKITSSHGIFYSYLVKAFSVDFARKYLFANQEAIDNIEKIVTSENIDCDFERKDSYIFTSQNDDLQKIEDEVSTVNLLGFPAEFVTTPPIPLKTVGAIKFSNQAQFHPRKYIAGLCNYILSKSGEIFERSKVVDIKRVNSNYMISTEKGSVTSKYLVLATHYPIVKIPGFYFLKMYQEASYLIGVETKSPSLDGMFLSTSSPSISLRTVKDPNKQLVLIGGSEHKVGIKNDFSNAFSELEKFAKQIYPDAKVLYRFGTQDCISLDKIPYIGILSHMMPNAYVATGFKKWGMSSSNVAANIIKDKILGQKNKFEDVFSSTRFGPIKNRAEFGNMLKESTYSLVLNRFNLPQATIDDIACDEGKIVKSGTKKIGVYKDINGKIFAIKPYCTHLGCELSWNSLEKTWDCPCHGSRFSYSGEPIYDPAIKDLTRPKE